MTSTSQTRTLEAELEEKAQSRGMRSREGESYREKEGENPRDIGGNQGTRVFAFTGSWGTWRSASFDPEGVGRAPY